MFRAHVFIIRMSKLYYTASVIITPIGVIINQLDAQNFCFTISLFHASTCFEHCVLIIRRSKLHYTASGIIIPIGVIINQLDAQNVCFTICLFRASTCFEHMCLSSGSQNCLTQPLTSLTDRREWSKITKIQFYKYEQLVVKFMCSFFECDYCVLLTVNMTCHVEVMFIQLLNLLQRHYVYLYLCLLSLSSHKIVLIAD